MRNAFVWFIFVSIHLYKCGGDEVAQEERVISSSPHRMVLRPVRGEMNRKSLRSLEDAIVNTLILQQLKEGKRDFFGNEVAIQEILHIEESSVNSTDSGSTSIQFFVTGLTFLNRSDDQLQLQMESLLASTFSRDGSLRHFLLLIRSDHILGGASTVSVRPLAIDSNVTLDPIDPMESEETTSRLVSTFGVFLICATGMILFGMVYTVAQHHIDRGYLQNERLMLFHRRQHDPSLSAGYSRNTATTVSGNEHPGHRERLPTGSRVTSNGIVREESAVYNVATNEINIQEPSIASSTAASAVPQHCLSPYRRFLSDNCKVQWSHPKRSLSLIRRNIAKSTTAFMQADNDNDDSVEEFIFEDKSDDSVDLFNVGCSPGESKANAASAVTDWMKTIRVVSRRVDEPDFVNEEEDHATRTMTTETIISPSVASSSTSTPSSPLSLASSAASSSGFSTGTSSSDDDSLLAEALSKLGHLSLDQVSLEQSMASSTIATNVKEKMEV